MLLIIFINGMATTQCYTYLHTRSPHYALPFYVSWLDSEITDLAGKRRFNGQSDYVYNIGFIQDIPSWGVAFGATHRRSEEHTSELQSLMRKSYAVYCLKKKRSNNILLFMKSY